MEGCKPIALFEGLDWVGAANPSLRVFDVVMNTKWGTTYNAYLVRGSKAAALIEAVKGGFSQEYIDALLERIDLKEIRYLVINHAEPDHSGALARVLEAMPHLEVLCSRAAAALLPQIANAPVNARAVGDGDSVDLGGRTLRFISAPFLHWPDTMFTYMPEDQVLFSGDVFGCHYAVSDQDLFEDQVDADELFEARKFYFDMIMSPFKPYMLQAIDKLRDLPIRMICPSHGPIARAGVRELIELNRAWAADVLRKNETPVAVIAYVSAYGYTRRLAEAMRAALIEAGIDAHSVDISTADTDELIERIYKADLLLVGSPTFNRDALPPVWALLSSLSTYRVKDKLAASFGSFGWSGEAARFIQTRFEQLGMKIAALVFRVKLQPSQSDLDAAAAFARAAAEQLTR